MNIKQLESLDKLAKLKKQGVLTQEEFRQEKQKILSDNPTEQAKKNDKGKNVSDFWIWILALSPLFLDFFVEFACGIFNLDYADVRTYLWLCFGFNAVICWLDSLAVSRAEPDNNLDFWWVLLVPVYIYKRSKIFCNYTYFWMWIICFVISLCMGV